MVVLNSNVVSSRLHEQFQKSRASESSNSKVLAGEDIQELNLGVLGGVFGVRLGSDDEEVSLRSPAPFNDVDSSDRFTLTVFFKKSAGISCSLEALDTFLHLDGTISRLFLSLELFSQVVTIVRPFVGQLRFSR
jgi:hypothetical protein